jgi:multidrug efflux pump subunit AcrA (membrane-fusion protein)
MKRLFLALCLLLGSCQLEQVLTPEQAAQVAELDAQAALAQDKLDQALGQADNLASQAAQALQLGDAAQLEEVRQALVALNDTIVSAEADRAAAVAGGDAVVREATQEQKAGFGALVKGTPLEHWVEFGYGLALLGFRRSRRHLKDALTNASKLQLAASILSVTKALGLLHTEEKKEPEQKS